MKKFKKFISSPKATLAVFGAAVALLLFSSIGGARAALTYYSETHMTEIETKRLDVALVEGENVVSGENGLFNNLLGEKEKFQIGKSYTTSLKARNTGTSDQYVRVTIYKYWVDSDGKKQNDVWPGYIELNLNEKDWVIDKDASTPERTVIYCTKLLPADSGADSEAEFANALRINPEVTKIVSEDAKGIISYDYAGLKSQVKIDVDAVQTHHAEDAILSSWGKTVTVGEDGSLDFGE